MAFNWYTAPTFGVMLLFWLLASYVLTRSPRSFISLTAVAAQVAAAAFLLGQGMQANAASVVEWRSWSRNLHWGATLAPALWYWLTVLLVREQEDPGLQRYLRWIGYPLGLIFAVASAFLTASIYVDGWLFKWSAPLLVPAEQLIYSHYQVLEGPLHPLFNAFLLGSTLGAALSTWLGWRLARDSSRRSRFAWLFLSSVLFFCATNTLGIAGSLSLVDERSIPVSHLLLGAAMLVMAWNIAEYSLLVKGQVIRTDVLYFLTSLAVICAVYAGAFVVLAGASYSFQALRLLMVLLILAVLTHAFVDVGRRALDPLFFSGDVQRLRSNLSSAVQDAALTPDLGTVLSQAQQEIEEVSTEYLARLTEEALRRLNNPAALARCELLARIPRLLAVSAAGASGGRPELTPLEQAHALRQALTSAIERLKPYESETSMLSPSALQYHILLDEYLRGMPNKQLMTRYSISESTFHRNRREAIAILAQELGKEEELLC